MYAVNHNLRLAALDFTVTEDADSDWPWHTDRRGKKHDARQ